MFWLATERTSLKPCMPPTPMQPQLSFSLGTGCPEPAKLCRGTRDKTPSAAVAPTNSRLVTHFSPFRRFFIAIFLSTCRLTSVLDTCRHGFCQYIIPSRSSICTMSLGMGGRIASTTPRSPSGVALTLSPRAESAQISNDHCQALSEGQSGERLDPPVYLLSGADHHDRRLPETCSACGRAQILAEDPRPFAHRPENSAGMPDMLYNAGMPMFGDRL